jgi:2-amino-4-hydroxy-6-hydroxymethyldihydropteridine diphosphokinase
VTRAFVGLGGNVGDVAARVRWADAELRAVRRSSLWRSAPVGPVADQPWFVNAVVELDTALDARAVLDLLLALEARAGRDRARAIPSGPRPLDLDLLLHGTAVVVEPDLVVPHPRLHERAFVLAPLEELVGPGFEIPGLGPLGPWLQRALETQRVVKIG